MSASPAPRGHTKGKSVKTKKLSAVPIRAPRAPVPSAAGDVPYSGPPAVTVARPVRTRPLRKMKIIPPPFRGESEERVEPVRPTRPTDIPIEDGRRQRTMGPARSAPASTGLSFEGIGTGLQGFKPCCGPPDANGHVGATEYVQWNNLSFAIWDKNGEMLYGPAAGNTLFQPLGGVCASHNDGDPVVNYDVLAGRWILSQLAVKATPGFSHQCVAVSLTSDATGSWNLYDFVTDAVNFVDYPHMAVWPDGYYMSAHIFNNRGDVFIAGRIYAFERDKMLKGQPARMVSKDLKSYSGFPQYGFLPADLDSAMAPPPGEAEFVLGPDPASTSLLDSTRVAVAWEPAASMTLTETQINASWGIAPCVYGYTACVPQPYPVANNFGLDNVDHHMMHRLAYRNFGGTPEQESIVGNITVAGSPSSPGHGAIRWFEFRNSGDSGTPPTVYQAATFDPDNDYRWMGSIAMDKDHDIALGYSKSSLTVKPSIWINGRLGTDPLNTLGAESEVMPGGGIQIGSYDWGDYSSMTLDPIDQCTFWYTNEYLPSDGSYNWATRIASFRFPSCTPEKAGNLNGTVTSCMSGDPVRGVIVSLGDGYTVETDDSGHYSVAVPPGTYTVAASGTDVNCSSSSPATVSVIVPVDGSVTQDFCMTGSSNLEFHSVAVNDSASGNGNGSINRNECVDLSVTIANNGCETESGATATLTTATPGVSVTRGSSFYPDLAAGGTGTNSIPFSITTSPTFVCGTIINLTLNVAYTGGASRALAFSVPTCGGGAGETIPYSLIDSKDPRQTDRLDPSGIPSACTGNICRGAYRTYSSYNYKTFTFTNSSPSPACVTVTIDAIGINTTGESVAYLGSTYNPPTLPDDPKICANYLGDSGVIGLGIFTLTNSYSFTVPAKSDFVVVVNLVDTHGSLSFSGKVTGLIDDTPGPGLCTLCTPPSAPSITTDGPTTFCAGNTVTLESSASAGNQWYRNGTAIDGATASAYVASASGSYTVTATDNGCVSSPSSPTKVNVNPIPATPRASNTGPYCEGQKIDLSTPAVVGGSYQWTGPNGFTSTLQNPARPDAKVTDAGTYSVVVTVNGCVSAAGTTFVEINPLPSTPAPSNDGPYCSGETISLSTQSVSSAAYHWTGPNGFTSTQRSPSRANATAADAGIYTVTVSVNGCYSAEGTTEVFVNTTPATPVATNDGSYCIGGTISLSTPTVAGATYSWTGPAGFTSSSQNPTRPAMSAEYSGTYAVTVTVNGCASAPGTTNVVVLGPTIAKNYGPYCEGETIRLWTTDYYGATYSWTGPNGFTSSLQNPTIPYATVSNAGTYSVMTAFDGCTLPAVTTTVVVNKAPPAPIITPSGPTTFCAGDQVTLTSSSATGNQWSLNGSTIDGAISSTYNATVSGSYSVVVTANGCTSAPSAPVSVTVNPKPSAAITTNPTISAGGMAAASVADAGPGATYVWNVTNGTIISGTGTQSIVFTAVASGAMSVGVTISSNGCSDTKTTRVDIIPLIEAVTPNFGPTAGGTNVTIEGSGFQAGVSVSFGGTPAKNIIRVSTRTVTATTPPQSPGAADVVVTNPDGIKAQRSGGFMFLSHLFDPNADTLINPADIFYLVNYIFLGGPAPKGPAGLLSGDANGDGKVDPSDIFFVVNYIFLSGPSPASQHSPISLQAAGGPLSGSMTLGAPIRRGNHYRIPVMVAASSGSAAPQALSLRVRFSGDPVHNPTVHHADGIQTLFEISRPSENAVSYLVTFDREMRDGAIAEIELDASGRANINVEIDPTVTLLSNRAGTRSATVAEGTLRVSGTNIEATDERAPKKEIE